MFPIYGLSIAHQAPSIVVRGPKDYRKTLKVTVYGMGWRLATAKGRHPWDALRGRSAIRQESEEESGDQQRFRVSSFLAMR